MTGREENAYFCESEDSGREKDGSGSKKLIFRNEKTESGRKEYETGNRKNISGNKKDKSRRHKDESGNQMDGFGRYKNKSGRKVAKPEQDRCICGYLVYMTKCKTKLYLDE